MTGMAPPQPRDPASELLPELLRAVIDNLPISNYTKDLQGRYVLNNLRKHRPETHPWYIDPYSSMSGEACTYMHDYDWSVLVVAAPRSWMLKQATAPPR